MPHHHVLPDVFNFRPDLDDLIFEQQARPVVELEDGKLFVVENANIGVLHRWDNVTGAAD